MFKTRRIKPEKGNKFYTRKASGGYSPCIKGSPTDSCDVLANCVGYADGRFNEIYSELTGFQGMKYPNFNCNAENFIERAKSYGLQISDVPVKGGIMVWQKGATLKSSDGAGHVAMVEEILAFNGNKKPIKVYTSESGYNSKAFWNSTRTNDNKRWGSGAGYKFRGCIVNPVVVNKEVSKPVERDTTKNQLKVNEFLNVRTGVNTTSESIGIVKKGEIHNWYEKKEGTSSYWFAIDPLKTQWIAGVNKNGHKYCEIYTKEEPKAEPTPTPKPSAPATTKFKVGDWVVPTKLVDVNGTNLRAWDKKYKIIKLSGNKATLSPARGGIWAVLPTSNIKKV